MRIQSVLLVLGDFSGDVTYQITFSDEITHHVKFSYSRNFGTWALEGAYPDLSIAKESEAIDWLLSTMVNSRGFASNGFEAEPQLFVENF